MPGICYFRDRIGMKENDSKLRLREGALIGAERGGASFRAILAFEIIYKAGSAGSESAFASEEAITMAVLMSDFPNAPEPTPGLWRFARQS